MTILFLGLTTFYLLDGEQYFRRAPVNPETAIDSEVGFQKLRRTEKKRVIQFQIDKIQKAINARNLAEADDRMKKLTVLAAKDEDFIAFEKQYLRQREDILAEENRKLQELKEKEEKKQRWLSEGQNLVNAKKYDQAKKVYGNILELFPEDADALERMQTADLLKEQEERQIFAKKQRYQMLERIYAEGVEKYESGQPGQSEELFKKVREEKGHPKYKRAGEYLSKIAAMTDQKLDDRINKAKEMIQNSATLVQGYQELKKLSSQFPLRSDAKKYLSEAKAKMEKKARELYADGLAQEELAGDAAAALDLYKEAIRFAPEPTDKYHIKAKEKIEALTL